MFLKFPRIPALDGLRALAVASVLGYHLFPAVFPSGFLGVDMFFALSGFLITALLLHEWQTTGALALGAFWRRRIRRLVPAGIAVLLVCSGLAAILGGDVLVGLNRQFIGAITYSSNWVAIANGSDYFAQGTPEIFTHFWSLAVEEQFYLVWPLLFMLFVSLIKRSVHWVLITVGLASFSAIEAAVLTLMGVDASRIYYGTDTHFFGLMLGAALALLQVGTPKMEAWTNSTVPDGEQPTLRAGTYLPDAIAGLCLAGFLVLICQPNDWIHDGGLLLGSLLTVGVIQGLIVRESPFLLMLRGCLSVMPLRWLGQRSYGIYLWHWPLMVLLHYFSPRLEPRLAGFIVIGLSVVVAGISYRWLEVPIRRDGFNVTLRRWISSGKSAQYSHPVLGSVAALLVLLAVVGTTRAIIEAPSGTALEQHLAAVNSELKKQPPLVATPPVATPRASPTSNPPSPPPQPKTPEPQSQDPAGDQMVVVGDSVALAAAPEIRDAFPGVYIDAAVNRSMQVGAEIIDQMASSDTLRPIIVVALATNATFPMSTLEGIEHTAGPDRKIVFVNSMAPSEIIWAKQANEVLVAAAQDFPNVTIADWHSAISSHLDLLAADGVHPGPEGGRIYAKTIANALGKSG